ncbi:hypothetical protein [Candidatus Paracaedibacter symbiosus]|uniref:hypothetical protein n=1 Tax=Candidatus Paracaedibacter symbiosus TaxID=244582 RepID=UPI003B96888E
MDCGSGSSQKEFKHLAKKTDKTDQPLPTLDEILNKKRFTNFGCPKAKKPMHIKGVILTHPDSDHINKLPSLFNQEIDTI